MIINDQASTLRLLAKSAMQELYYSKHSAALSIEVIGYQTKTSGRDTLVRGDKNVIEKLKLAAEIGFDIAALENNLSLPVYFHL